MFFQQLKEQLEKKGNFDMQRIQRVYDLSKSIHAHQKRKTGEPYIIHPVEVAFILNEAGANEDMICAALLHDVIENKGKHKITNEYLVTEFGEKVAKLIEILSKMKIWKTSYCRMKGNLTDLENGFHNYPEAIIVKIADRIHNLQTLYGFDEKKQKEYLKETECFLMPIFRKSIKKVKSEKNLEIIKQLLKKLEFEFNVKKGRFPKPQSIEKEGSIEDLGIIKYEGWEGIKRAYEEILAEAIKTGEDILAFERNKDFNMEEIFTKEYVDSRIRHKVKALVICPQTKEDYQYKKKYENKYTKVKLIKNLLLDASINIVGDLIMSFSTNPERGTLRRDKAEANTLKFLFKNKNFI